MKKITKIKKAIIEALEEKQKSPLGNLVGGFIAMHVGNTILNTCFKGLKQKGGNIMTKKCENCGLVDVEGDRDVCEECIDKVMKQNIK